jgi:hypothetical protein
MEEFDIPTHPKESRAGDQSINIHEQTIICFIERPSLYGTVNTPSQLQNQ